MLKAGMSSKLVAANKGFFSKMVVDAVMSIDQDIMPLEMIGIKKVPGGALEESQLINGNILQLSIDTILAVFY